MSQGVKKTTYRKQAEQLQISNINLIQQEIQKKLINPEDSNYCTCNICQQKYQLKELGKTFLRQTNSSSKVQSQRMQQFFTLISSVNAKQYLKLDIPQICFFKKGQPRKLFRSNNLGVHQIQLTSTIKKNLINIFLESKKSAPSLKEKQSSSTLLMKTNANKQDVHIKLFNSVIPSLKHGDLYDDKHPQNFIFHNNPQYENDPNKLLHKNTDEQICLIKYKQKSYELINQKQLRGILKSLLALQNVEFIQSYIKPSDQEDQIFEASYDCFKKQENQLMWSRSLVQVKIDVNLINKFSKDYICPEHLDKYESEVLRDIPQQYCMYQNYKIVHYMELMKDMKVEKLNTLWLMQSSGEIIFFGLVEFQWRQNEKFSVDVGQIQQLKELVSAELSDFESELLKAWESMKTRKQMHLQKKQVIDEEKQRQIEKIKKQNQMRISKELTIQKTRKKSFSQSHPSKNRT